MSTEDDEEPLLRSVALQTAQTVQLARMRAERDLIEAKEALEQRTRELAELLAVMRATLESTTNGILAVSDAGVLTYNAKLLEMWSLSPSDMSTHAKVLDAMSHQAVSPNCVRDLRAEVIELKDGRVFERFSKLQRIGERGVGRVWSFSDITERRRAEQESARQYQRFRFMAESMPQKIFTATPDGRIDYVNAQMKDYTGLDKVEWHAVTHPDDTFLASWDRACATGTALEHEHRLRAADGNYRWHLSRVRPLREDGEAILMWIGSSTDIDDMKKVAEERTALLDSERAARTEIERTSQMKDEFLATLSHELRTPLNAILGWSQILAGPQVDEPILQQGLQTIERNARAQTQLIEDLLDMSRIISGKIRLDIQPVRPVSFVDAAIEAVSLAAQAKSIVVERVLDPNAGPVAGDPSRLQQVLWNLLSNAIKFTPRGGKVQVTLRRVNSHVELCVADDGIGVEPEFLPHVFERFRQADATTTRKFGGLGLGLSIVKQLVELHGGTVTVKSAGMDKGTTFSVKLPLAAAYRDADDDGVHPSSARAATLNAVTVDLSGVKILVVDDEADARDLLSHILSARGASVFTVSSANDAVDAVERERPDILVSDIGLPDVDGYELLRRVRALGPSRGGRLPAIALTAFARSEDRTRALRAGFAVHVAKPVEASELVATVAAVAGRSEGDVGTG